LYPSDFFTCSSEPVLASGKDDRLYDLVAAEIKKQYSLKATRAEKQGFAACVVRVAGHDLMDFNPDTGKGGTDGCIDFNDHDNAGLKGCLLESIDEIDSVNVSLESMWQDYCLEVSAADFFVITAEALMEATTPIKFRHGVGQGFEKLFKFGRETKLECHPDPLPNPAESCDAVEKNFIDKLGLSWTGATALMGVHTLGRALPSNSGYDGWWVSGIHAKTFSNKYYSNMIGVGWTRKKTSAGKWQWVRADGKFRKEIMLNTDMCLGFHTGANAPHTRAEDDSHGNCCVWHKFDNRTGRSRRTANREFMEGVPCDCQGTDASRGCGSHRNCCRSAMGPRCGAGFSENNAFSTVKGPKADGVRERMMAVSKFAKSMEDWISEFLPTWTKVTNNGMDLCPE